MKMTCLKRLTAVALAAVMMISECVYASEIDLIGSEGLLSDDSAYGDDIVMDASEDTSDFVTEDIDNSGVEADPSLIETLNADDTLSENEPDKVSTNGIPDKAGDEDIDHDKPLSQDEAMLMFPGLPDEAMLDQDDLDDKDEVADHLMDSAMGVEGQDYAEGQILVLADDEARAEEYAAAYNGRLEKYSYGLAVIDLNADEGFKTASVMDAICASANPENPLPAAWPNHYRYNFDEAVDVKEGDVGPDFNNDIYEYAEASEDETDVYYDENGETAANGAPITDPDVFRDPMLKPDYRGQIWEKTSSGYKNLTLNAYQWQHNLVGSRYAWQAGQTGAGVRVCVIDSGVISSHQDLSVTGKYETGGLGEDDGNGHGTNVAGIIAARGNEYGGRGVAPDAELYTINAAYTNEGTGGYEVESIRDAIYYAVDTWKVDIINMSLGGPAYNAIEAEAVKYAYDHGVAVFCAAGNESTSGIAYPAGFPGAISVGAVDKGNKKAVFSNSGGVVFSGPGVEIYSTSFGGSDKYSVMSGTSQATPCISGVAAVLLGSGRVAGEKGTAARVENLKNLMIKGCVKSGLGKGTPNLARCLGLGVSTSAPAKPTVTLKPGTYMESSVGLKFDTIPGAVIYYTKDGSKPVYKNGAKSANSLEYTDGSTIDLDGAANVALKAIAVSDTNKLASKVATFKYTLKPYVSSVTDVRGTNELNVVVRGGSLQMHASVQPAYAANKKIKWSLGGEHDGVTISDSGLIKVSRTSTVNMVEVCATAADRGTISGYSYVYVSDNGTVQSIKASPASITVYNNETAAITATVTGQNKEPLKASECINPVSSDTNIVRVVSFDNNTITVRGIGKGSAKVILAASDGSGRTASVKVTVKQYVSAVHITNMNDIYIAQGKKFKPAASVSPSNATNKKLIWSLESVPSDTTIASCGVSVNSKTGAITTKADTPVGEYGIKVTSKDGHSSETGHFMVIGAASRVASINVPTKKATLFRVQNTYGSPTSKDIAFTALNAGGSSLVSNDQYLSITSSAPDLVSVYRPAADYFTIRATGNGTGTAVITVASRDGTGIKKTFKVSVVNPPSSIRLAPPAGRSKWLARGKKMKLSTVIETDYGPVSKASRKFKYYSARPSYMSVNGKGSVKAKASSGEVTITAQATDGSGVNASYTLRCCTPVMKLKPYRKKVNIAYGGSTNVYASAYVRWSDSYSYNPSYSYNIKVNKQGLGIRSLDSYGGYGALVVGNKRGKYKVTVTMNDGSKAKCTFTVTVK